MSEGLSFQSAPRISQRSFVRILVRAQSPAAADGPRLYDLVASYGLDPAVALAFFAHESSYGRPGVAARSLNWGNLRRGPRAYAIRGGFGYYHSWADSLQDWCELILNRYARRGLTTVETAIPVYAPSSDHNAPQRYIAAVRALVEQWMREECAADLGPVSKVVAVTTAVSLRALRLSVVVRSGEVCTAETPRTPRVEEFLRRGEDQEAWQEPINRSVLLLSSCQPSPHIRLMLFMEMGKEITRFDGLSFQPWKIARWIAEDFIG